MYNKVQQILLNSFERLTGYIANISSDHAYIHKGKAFTYSASYAVAGSTDKECYFVTPANVIDVHFRPLVFSSSASAIKVDLYEEGTYSGGTELIPFNRNRNMTNTALMKLYDGTPTITADGTLLLTSILGSTGNPNSISGGSGGDANEEILLKRDTKYMIRCTNLTATDTTVSMQIFWYEEEQYT